REAASHLNNAAWYAIFGKTDDEARRQAERAVELAPQDGGILNTLAAVDAELGLWDDAIRTLLREAQAEDSGDVHHKGYYWVRARIAEALGRPAIAATMYGKIARSKLGNADDVYRLAQPRLKLIAP